MSSHRTRHASVLLAWAAVATAAIGSLHAPGGGALAPPPLTSPSAWGAWLEGRDPVVAAFAVARVLALGTAWYVVVVAVVGAAARLVSDGRLVAAVDRMTLPVLRRLVVATVGVSLGTGGPAPTLAGEGPLPVTATTTTVAVTGGDAGPPSTVTMRRLPPSPPADLPAGTGERRWTVTPGQCFWSIAEAVLADDLGRPPAPAEVVPYWQRLIEANRSALADPANADLVYPGQVFTVPAP